MEVWEHKKMRGETDPSREGRGVRGAQEGIV